MAAIPQVTISVNQAALNRIIMAVKDQLESMFLSGIDDLPRRTSAFINLGERMEIFSFVDAALNMFTERPRLSTRVVKVRNNMDLRSSTALLLPNTAAVERLVFNTQVENIIEKEVNQLAHASDVMLSNETYSPFLFIISIDDNASFINILIHRIKTNFLRYYIQLLEDYRCGIQDLSDSDHKPGASRPVLTPNILPEDLENLTQQLQIVTT